MPRPHHADDVGALQVATAQGIDHRRGVRGLDQAMGVVLVGEVRDVDAVFMNEGFLLHGALQHVTAVAVAIDLAAPAGEAAQLLLAHAEELLLAADDVEQLAGQVHTHALQAGKGDAPRQ